MPKINIDIPHSLSNEEAKERGLTTFQGHIMGLAQRTNLAEGCNQSLLPPERLIVKCKELRVSPHPGRDHLQRCRHQCCSNGLGGACEHVAICYMDFVFHSCMVAQSGGRAAHPQHGV